jgi:CRISPR-associated endonuclease/helicase Cas3
MSGTYTDSAQTWNVPIVITTMVQFLESLFASGTRKIRRMHQLSNAVIIFDEIQTLPVSCTYLFTWAANYLQSKCKSSLLFCTATQPGLDKLRSKEYAIHFSEQGEIISNLEQHFDLLKRVELVNIPGAKTLNEVADFIEELPELSILTVVNTKSQARKLYAELSARHKDWKIIHLSTNMCPAHRKELIEDLKKVLPPKDRKIVCISTRLIEAGVDIDFDCAIRFLSGFDSIIQTAGRCNRNGRLKDAQGNDIPGKVYIIEIVSSDERLNSLKELQLGQEIMKRILRIFDDDKKAYGDSLLHVELIKLYFRHFYNSIDENKLKYNISPKVAGCDTTEIDLLSMNDKSRGEYSRINPNDIPPIIYFCQSFDIAWSAFEVIAENTIGILVPFKEGKTIITSLYSEYDPKEIDQLLRKGQQYSVNVRANYFRELEERGLIYKIREKLEVYAVTDGYYTEDLGLSQEFGKMIPRII